MGTRLFQQYKHWEIWGEISVIPMRVRKFCEIRQSFRHVFFTRWLNLGKGERISALACAGKLNIFWNQSRWKVRVYWADVEAEWKLEVLWFRLRFSCLCLDWSSCTRRGDSAQEISNFLLWNPRNVSYLDYWASLLACNGVLFVVLLR